MSLVTNWITKIPRLKNSKVARFSYRAEAYANDNIEGVSSYDYAQDMNVPLATHTDFDHAMLSIGARANLSSVPKNGLNHFFGRVSYNLNKVIDFLDDLLTDFVSFTEVLYISSATALTTYTNGTTKRLLNTSDGIIDVTLPTGETYNGSQILKLEPFKLLVILKVGTVWINAGSGDGTAVDTLPAASEVYKDKILQYIGDTDEDYTSGWFYKCVETSPSVYEWQDIQVQDTPSNIITGFYENGKLWKGTNAEYLALDASIRTNDAITFIVTDIESDVPQLISDSTVSAETTWSSNKINTFIPEKATKLETPRLIGSALFDGTANINLGQILAIPNIKIQAKASVTSGDWTFPNSYSSWVFVFWTTDSYWGSPTNGISSCYMNSVGSVYGKGATLSVCTAPVSSPSQWKAFAIGV